MVDHLISGNVPNQIMLAGSPVDKIMLGTGSAAEQIWPLGPPRAPYKPWTANRTTAITPAQNSTAYIAWVNLTGGATRGGTPANTGLYPPVIDTGAHSVRVQASIASTVAGGFRFTVFRNGVAQHNWSSAASQTVVDYTFTMDALPGTPPATIEYKAICRPNQSSTTARRLNSVSLAFTPI